MSIHASPTADVTRATSVTLSHVTTLLDRIDHDQRAAICHDERLSLVTQARSLANRMDALVAILVAEADQAGSSMATRGTPLTTWLSMSGAVSVKDAAGLVLGGRDLAAHPRTRDAALSGELGSKQARTIHHVMTQLPGDLRADQFKAAEDLLVQRARSTSAERLATLAPGVLAAVAPDHPAASADNQLTRLAAQRQRAVRKRSLVFLSDGDGSTLIRGSLPTADAAPLIKLIDSYVESDRRRGRDGRDRLAEMRTPEQRRADALLVLVDAHQRSRRAPAVAGDRPRVVVLMRAEDLRQRAEHAGILDSGQAIGAGELRRLCCDAELMPAVLGTESEILDIGRIRRLVTPAIRRALSIRDGGCVFPECDAADARCDAHHIEPWWAGGATALSNLVTLCPHHHQLVEPPSFWDEASTDRWEIRLDESGFPEVLPPRRMDLDRKPIATRRCVTMPRTG